MRTLTIEVEVMNDEEILMVLEHYIYLIRQGYTSSISDDGSMAITGEEEFDDEEDEPLSWTEEGEPGYEEPEDDEEE